MAAYTKAPESAMDDEDEEAICRYCFDTAEEGPLISPCRCSGGQKFVHLACLRQWQRMVLVSQPTHPAFYDRDLRHQTCNVCKSEFTCPPPTRHELMQSFTGPEIAALIDVGCVIAAHEVFSNELQRQMMSMHMYMRPRCSYEHWIRGMYLITNIEEDRGHITLPLRTASELEKMRERLGESLAMSVQGRRLRLIAGGSLEDATLEGLRESFNRLEAPSTICLGPEEEVDCGDDHVVAVNLTRPMEFPPQPALVESAIANVTAKYPSANQVTITHFIGGPCDVDDLRACVVLGGGGRGWKVVTDLEEAIELACGRAAKRCQAQGQIGGGQTVRVHGLQAAPELNGEIGLTLRFLRDKKRWLVRLRNGEGKQIKPVNLEPGEGGGGRVFAVWGDARWSRAQLLGEIARGHWGLCRANVSDLTSEPSERWRNMEGRLAFAPQTDMTEDFMRDQMIRARAAIQAHQPAASDDEPEIDD